MEIYITFGKKQSQGITIQEQQMYDLKTKKMQKNKIISPEYIYSKYYTTTKRRRKERRGSHFERHKAESDGTTLTEGITLEVPAKVIVHNLSSASRTTATPCDTVISTIKSADNVQFLDEIH